MPLIINADDFGLTRGVNEAVFELVALGALSSTSVMVNMPFAEEAKPLAGLPHCSVGLHLNLTEGCPVANTFSVASLVDVNGHFYSNGVFRKRLRAGRVKQKEIEIELKAQYSRLNEILGRKPSHIDSHQNIHKAPAVARILCRYGAKQSETRVRMPARYMLVFDHDQPEFRNSFLESLKRMKLRRAASELYLHGISAYLKSSCQGPTGELYSPSFQKLDLLHGLAKNEIPGLTDKRIFEIACHPAKDTNGLKDSKLIGKRLLEYQVMRTDAFLKNIHGIGLCSFSDLHT